MTITDSRPAIPTAISISSPLTGPGSLSGHEENGNQTHLVAEGQDSPQATRDAAPSNVPPAGNETALPATVVAASIDIPQEGRQAGHGQSTSASQSGSAVADHVPGGQLKRDGQFGAATGDSTAGRPAAMVVTTPTELPSLADPLLALAADVLDDLEKVRIANENRLRQLTRSTEDVDGETRGFGLDESHPDVARLAGLVQMLADAEHKAELNLGRLMRKHPLGPWVKATAGIGEKQGARLIASIGDPYVRPEIVRADGSVEPSRPRMASELWAYCGYHVIETPVSGHCHSDIPTRLATDGPDSPVGQAPIGTHMVRAGGEQADHPGHNRHELQTSTAGVAPKRQRGARANWSATAKMRAYLVAVSCMKCLDSPYRVVYEDTRAKYADAVHRVPCVRCGPKNKPAEPGSPLSDGHKHARALRAVAKEVLRDLWREAKRIHEDPASGHWTCDGHIAAAAGGQAEESAVARRSGAA